MLAERRICFLDQLGPVLHDDATVDPAVGLGCVGHSRVPLALPLTVKAKLFGSCFRRTPATAAARSRLRISPWRALPRSSVYPVILTEPGPACLRSLAISLSRVRAVAFSRALSLAKRMVASSVTVILLP